MNIKLLTKENRKQLPKLYAQENAGEEAIAYVKFFTPDSNWTWYVLEFDGEDTFFGLVDGFSTELGYFSLLELSTVRGKLGLPIERDMYYTPETLKTIKERIARQ